jgi:hypothetical protein
MSSILSTKYTLKQMRRIEFVLSCRSGAVGKFGLSWEVVALTQLARQLHENALYPRNSSDSRRGSSLPLSLNSLMDRSEPFEQLVRHDSVIQTPTVVVFQF